MQLQTVPLFCQREFSFLQYRPKSPLGPLTQRVAFVIQNRRARPCREAAAWYQNCIRNNPQGLMWMGTASGFYVAPTPEQVAWGIFRFR